MQFIEFFPYIIKYKQGKQNIVANALSRRYALISKLDAKLLGFEYIKDLYNSDLDFANVYRACEKGGFDKFFMHDGLFYFFQRKQAVYSSMFNERIACERGM